MGSPLAELQTTVRCLEADMKAMEEGLGKVPFPKSVLVMKQGSAEYFWGEVRRIYVGLRVLTEDEKAEVEPITSGELQAQYEDLDARVEKAIDDYNQDKEARKRDAKIRAETWKRVNARMEEPKKPVAKKVAKKAIKASAACALTPKKKRQKKTKESLYEAFSC